jgi:hypothetical protein
VAVAVAIAVEVAALDAALAGALLRVRVMGVRGARRLRPVP